MNCLVQGRPYTIRVRKDDVDIWDDLDFRCRFRLKKETVIIIKQAIERDYRLLATCMYFDYVNIRAKRKLYNQKFKFELKC